MAEFPNESIFGSLDYRDYLRRRVEALRTEGRFSERRFAARAGFRSPSYLKMILDGKRNLGERSLPGLGRALKLTKPELRYLAALIRFNDAKDPTQKSAALGRLMQFRKFQSMRELDPAQYAYFTNWFYVALREALACAWSERPARQLAKALGISEAQLKLGLETLETLGLVARDARGHYRPREAALKTPSEIRSVLVRDYHRQMLAKAAHALDTLPQEKRAVSALTLPLTRENYLRVKERIDEFRAQINAEFSEEKSADQVFAFTFQLFPLLRTEDQEDAIAEAP